MSAHSAGAYTATLLVMVNVKKGGGRAPPIAPARANFTIMTECMPESSCSYSVYSVPQTNKTPAAKKQIKTFGIGVYVLHSFQYIAGY